MRLAFVKMHGLGNDFIVFDAPPAGPLPSAAQLRRLADRHTGIGFDQALLLEPPRHAGSAISYRVFNADGTEVEQCGNGARCIAALVGARLGRGPGPLRMDSAAGVVEARTRADGLVSVAMGVPDFAPRALPFEAAAEQASYALALGAATVEIGAVAIGNPHAVLIVERVADARVDSLGPLIENHPRFPRHTNVEFMEIVAPDHIRLRVHERGVGETRACGTGACGAVAVGRRRGLLAAQVQVDLPGGRVSVDWRGEGEPIWLTGPTATVFEGYIDL
jgi:diaminopimelate epimerase